MADGRLGTSEEVIENGNFMAEDHETVNQMGTDKAGATGDKDALALRRREELDGGEAGEGGVGDGLDVRVVDRLGLVGTVSSCELCVFHILFLLLAVGGRLCSHDIVGTEVERPQDIEGHFAVKTKALEANGGDDIAVLVESANLRRSLVSTAEDNCGGLRVTSMALDEKAIGNGTGTSRVR